MPQNV